jgi:hypothetical protein
MTPTKVGFLSVKGFQCKYLCTMFLSHRLIYVLPKNLYTFTCLKLTDEKNLGMVLQVLIEHTLYTKLSKYIFYQNKIHYLGHII